jgi:agmatine deiminase
METNTKYRMPAEWEPHEATWLNWPHNQNSWPGNFEPIPIVYVQLIEELVKSERVFINVNDDAAENTVRRLLEKNHISLDQITFHRIPSNDAWIRDCGAIFVKQGKKLIATNWKYNAWGEKYPPWDLDNAIPEKMAEKLSIECTSIHMVLEGGSIDVNGSGTLLTTEQCLLNKNRNPQMEKRSIEEKVKTYLGVKNIIWLKEGIVGDDTDGHIDDIARFVSHDTIVAAVEVEQNDANFEILKSNLETLNKYNFNIIEVPMPEPVIYEGERLPASYMNFYIANSVVVVPTFSCPQDDEALDILQSCFQDRQVIGINARELVWGLGAFHCITQQVPSLTCRGVRPYSSTEK